MLKLGDKDINTGIRTVFHVFEKLRWDIEHIKKTQVELLEINNTMDGIDSRLDTTKE